MICCLYITLGLVDDKLSFHFLFKKTHGWLSLRAGGL